MKEEVMRILKMLEENKIKAEEAYRLIDAILDISNLPKSGKFIKIYVESEDGDEVKITVPIGLVRMLTNFVPKEAKSVINDFEIDLNELMKAIEEGASGTLIDVEGKDGEVVKIVVE